MPKRKYEKYKDGYRKRVKTPAGSYKALYANTEAELLSRVSAVRICDGSPSKTLEAVRLWGFFVSQNALIYLPIFNLI